MTWRKDDRCTHLCGYCLREYDCQRGRENCTEGGRHGICEECLERMEAEAIRWEETEYVGGEPGVAGVGL